MTFTLGVSARIFDDDERLEVGAEGISADGDAVTIVSSRSSSSVIKVGIASRFVPKSEVFGGGALDAELVGSLVGFFGGSFEGLFEAPPCASASTPYPDVWAMTHASESKTKSPPNQIMTLPSSTLPLGWPCQRVDDSFEIRRRRIERHRDSM